MIKEECVNYQKNRNKEPSMQSIKGTRMQKQRRLSVL